MPSVSNIGTLFAFVLVSIGVSILRFKEPDRPRPFRVPFAPVTASTAVLADACLMFKLPNGTWIRFFARLGSGSVIYYLYGYGHSRLRTGTGPGQTG